MANLTKDKQLKSKPLADLFSFPVKANAVLYKGAGICLDTTGYAVRAADTAGFKTLGIADEKVDATGAADGAKSIKVLFGRVFLLDMAGAVQADVGKPVYWVDDQTVALAATTLNDVFAGYIFGLEGGKVWVFVPQPFLQ